MNKFLLLLTIPFLLFACSSDSETYTSKDLRDVKPVNIQFLETYSLSGITYNWDQAAKWIQQNDSILSTHQLKAFNLYAWVQSSAPINYIGTVKSENMTDLETILNLPEVRELFPKDLKFMWSLEPEEQNSRASRYILYAVKTPKSDGKQVNGKCIKEAKSIIDQNSNSVVINLSMTEKGSRLWSEMTRYNVGNTIAITVDDRVLSCPIVNMAIEGGVTEIRGDFSIEEAKNLADRINAGRSR